MVSFVEFKLEESIVTVPDASKDRFDVVVIFGGLHYATPEWMQKQTPDELMQKAIVVFSPYWVEYPTVIKRLGPFLGSHNLLSSGVSGASVLGFSRGGINALDAYTPRHKFIGLIDPSFRAAHAKRTYSRNTAMLWGSRGMVGLFGEANYVKLAAGITGPGGLAERRGLAHDRFPKIFLEEFKSRLA